MSKKIEHNLILYKLFGKNKTVRNANIQTIKDIFKSSLNINNQLLDTSPSKHHIIFKNAYNGGNRNVHGINGITLERGIHTSFHELMQQKKLYPHEHFTRLFKMEKSILSKESWDKFLELETEYNKIFGSNPLDVYRKEAFHPKLWSLWG